MRLALYAALALAVLAGGWSGAWFLGRGAVADRLDGAIAALGREGVTLTAGARAIGGFPLAYDIRLEDVTLASGDAGLSMPWIAARATPLETGRLALTLPATMELAIAGALAPLTIELEGATGTVAPAEVEGLPGIETVLDLPVIRSVERQEGPGGAQVIAVEAGGTTLRLAVPAPPGDPFGAPPQAARRLLVEIARLDAIDQRSAPPDIPAPIPVRRSDLAARDLLATLRWVPGPPGNAAGNPAGNPAGNAGTDATEARVSLQSGTVTIETRRAPDDPEPAGSLAIGTLAGAATLAEDIVTSRLTIDEIAAAGTIPAEGDTPERLGRLTIDRLDWDRALPIRRLDRPVEVSWRLSAGEITPDAAIWALVDPAEALPRESGRIHLTLAGQRAPDDVPDAEAETGDTGPGPLARLETLDIDLALRGAGASAEGRVALALPQDGLIGGEGRLRLD
ncbi:MAG: DUF2125 domain-containing protein, partial [Pseudomonadota bacterium]